MQGLSTSNVAEHLERYIGQLEVHKGMNDWIRGRIGMLLSAIWLL